MTKLILAFHGADLALDDADLRARLAATGVTRFQLNVDDEPVAGALRFGPGDPITAFVTLWTDGDPEAAIAVLTDLEAGVHAWRVTERRPIEPPQVADGERADALANIAVLRRPEGMTREEYLEIWLGSHTQIAIDTQNTFGYIQNIVEEALTPDAPGDLGDRRGAVPDGGADRHPRVLRQRWRRRGAQPAHDRADGQRRAVRRRPGLDLVPTSRYVWELA